MKARFLPAIVIGGVVGASFGLAESVAWLFQIPWWLLDTPTVAVAMGIYGGIVAFLSGLWALTTRPMDPRAFRPRALVSSLSSLLFVAGGFYLNRLFFPAIHTPQSLGFTALWTAGWLVLCLVLSRYRVRMGELVSDAGGMGRWYGLAGLLGIMAAVSFVPPCLWAKTLAPMGGKTPLVDAPRPNVLLIVMDTTRADHFSSYGYPRPTTPNIDRLAEEGVLFEQANAAAPWTLPTHASLFTGLYVSQHGTDATHRRLDDQQTTLPELLREYGYQTAGYSNNPHVSRATNFQQGFDYFEESWKGGRLLHRLTAVRVFDKIREVATRSHDDDADLTNWDILSWFRQVYEPDRPFFLFVNYMEPHFLYVPPEPYRGRFLRAENRPKASRLRLESLRRLAPPVHFDSATQATLTDLYDAEIAYLDMKIGEILDELRRRRLLEDTLVIVTSDHGESIGEHEIFEHEFSVHQTLTHVPMILRYPKAFPAGTRIQEPVSSVDVMPTLTKLLGLEVPPILREIWLGSSWVGSPLRVPQDRMIVAEYGSPVHLIEKFTRERNQVVDESYFKRSLKSLRRGNWKFIWTSDGRHELYDLSQDPGETENLAEKFPEKAQAMKEELDAIVSGMKTVGPPEPVGQMDAATLERIRGLGYLH